MPKVSPTNHIVCQEPNMKILVSIAALACASLSAPTAAIAQDAANAAAAPTVSDADAFVARAEKDLFDFSVEGGRVAWINATYLTDDTDAIAARYGEIGTEKAVGYALEAAKYQALPWLSYDTKRKLDILRGGIVLPAPTTPGAAAELATISTKLQSSYGKGRGTLLGKEINGSDIEAEMGSNRNPDELKEMWVSWHDNVGAPMGPDYARMVEIANKGATELGYADVGAMLTDGRLQSAEVSRSVTLVDVHAIWVGTDYDDLCPRRPECIWRDARCCTVSAVEHDLQAFEAVGESAEQVNQIAVFGVGEGFDSTDSVADGGKLGVHHRGLDSVFDAVVELVAASCKNLDAVVWGIVVRCGNHHAKVSAYVGD
jgi:peptidyl-dipeptidase A